MKKQIFKIKIFKNELITMIIILKGLLTEFLIQTI